MEIKGSLPTVRCAVQLAYQVRRQTFNSEVKQKANSHFYCNKSDLKVFILVALQMFLQIHIKNNDTFHF